jgi:hypothetical protein
VNPDGVRLKGQSHAANRVTLAPNFCPSASSPVCEMVLPIIVESLRSWGYAALQLFKPQFNTTLDGWLSATVLCAAAADRLSVPMKVRQQWLGHGDASITLGIYTHAVGEDSLAVAGQLGRIVGGNRSKFWTQTDAN